MFEALSARGRALAERAKHDVIARLAARTLPPGAGAEAREDGVVLKGRALRRRAIVDPRLREALR